MHYLIKILTILAAVFAQGDDRYRVRNLATAYLSQLGGEALVGLEIGSVNQEIASRNNYLLECLLKKRLAKYDQNSPEIDCLPKSWPDRRQVINRYYSFGVANAQCLTHYNGLKPCFPIYREGGKRFLRDLVWQGYTDREIAKIIDIMRRNEQHWLKSEPME